MIRYRRQVACLDNILALTLGGPLSPLAILSSLNPARGSYTGVASGGNGAPKPVGQVHYHTGKRSARLAFLFPEQAARQEDVVLLLEQLAYEAGVWGACNVLAEVEENSPLYEALRKAGFVVYARQQIWQLEKLSESHHGTAAAWQPALSVDEIAIRSLYQSLVPPLVQSAEACPESQGQNLVYRPEKDELLACGQVWLGPRGAYIQPLFHPGVNNTMELLIGLAAHIVPRPSRPLYLAVRSYQAELESDLTVLGAAPGPRQVLMAKYLVNMQRLPAFNPRTAMLERRAEPTTSIVPNLTQSSKTSLDAKKN